MTNDRFKITGTLDGQILTVDPCASFLGSGVAHAANLANKMRRGLQAVLARPGLGVEEPMKTAMNQVDPLALAHFIGADKASMRNNIENGFKPRFDQVSNTPADPLSTLRSTAPSPLNR